MAWASVNTATHQGWVLIQRRTGWISDINIPVPLSQVLKCRVPSASLYGGQAKGIGKGHSLHKLSTLFLQGRCFHTHFIGEKTHPL